MNNTSVRDNFPIFSHYAPGGYEGQAKGSKQPLPFSVAKAMENRLVYLDNAASTHKPDSVIDIISIFYSTSYATVHRALYDMGEQATTQYEQVRTKVQAFIHAAQPEEIIFTKGTTESINFIAQSWALQHLKAGDQIVLTQAEHHANLLPWQRIAIQTGAELVFIPVDPKTFQLINPENYISQKTKLVAVAHSSNVLGSLWQFGQLESLITKAHAVGAKVLIDAAQSIAHQHIDVEKLNADFLAFSAHKMFGPTGVGVLYIKKELHDDVQPYQLGGSMVYEVTFDQASWAKAPQKFEAGTPPIAAIMGLGAAIDFITQHIKFDQLKEFEAKLCKQLLDGLNAIPGIVIAGDQQTIARQGHIVSFAVPALHPHDIASHLGSKNIAIRAGHHCAQPLVTHLGFQSLLRVSVAAYTTPQDIDIFLFELKNTLTFLTKHVT